MKRIIEEVYCDICHERANNHKKIQVIFSAEQTEGHECKPYVDEFLWPLDLCDKCLGRILDGNYVFASGAQGYNDYYFKKEK